MDWSSFDIQNINHLLRALPAVCRNCRKSIYRFPLPIFPNPTLYRGWLFILKGVDSAFKNNAVG